MFPERITRLRKTAGLSQKQLADRLNVSIDSIRRWEQGKRSPDIATLNKIAQNFDVSVSFLVEEQKDENNMGNSHSEKTSRKNVIDDPSFVKEGNLIASGRVLFYKDDNGKTFIFPATEENQSWFRDFMTKTIVSNTTTTHD